MTNVAVVEGFLQKDAELKHVGAKETALLTFVLVNTTGFGDFKKTSYFDCELWGKVADSVHQYFAEGLRITLHGEMIQDKWTADDGTKKSRWKLKGRDFSFGGQKNGENQQKPRQEDTQAPSYTFDDDVPF